MSERIAVVTGATGGIGRTIVENLSRDHRVIAVGRNPEKLRALATLPGVEAVECDLTVQLLDGTFDALDGLPRIDVLVNAAAIAERRSVEQASVRDWRLHLDTNVVAPAELTRKLLPALRAAEGLVVFINSGAGRGAYPGNTVYAATKHALYALADALRKEEASAGVRVTSVAPGPVDTPMLEGLTASAGGDYSPEHYIVPAEVAAAVRAAVDAGPSAQIADVSVRPRIELADRR